MRCTFYDLEEYDSLSLELQRPLVIYFIHSYNVEKYYIMKCVLYNRALFYNVECRLIHSR